MGLLGLRPRQVGAPAAGRLTPGGRLARPPESCPIHRADEVIGDHLRGVRTEDEMERVAKELDEALSPK